MNSRAFSISIIALSLLAAACGDGELSVDLPTVGPDNVATIASELSAENRRERAELIRDSAAQSGLTNAVLLAGIADAETNFAHCWSEARWACKGPASSSCGGGPVIAGSADGPCSIRQGGLGMFQFDAGTHSDTLAREGRRILTVEGNTQAAVDFVVYRVQISDFIPGVSTEAEALEWMNAVRPDTPQWDQWIRTVTGYYNGCFEGRCSVFHERYNNYDSKTRNMLSEMGEDFWYGGAGSTSQPPGSGTSAPGGDSDDDSSRPSGSGNPASGVPSRPSDLNPVDASVPSGNSVNLSWHSVDATQYTLRMEYDVNGRWQHYYEWERNRSVFEVWPQAPDTTYRWAVLGCNAMGCSDWSDWSYFTYGNASSSSAPTDSSNSNGGSSSSGDSSGSDPSGTPSGGNTSPPPSSGAPGMPGSMRPAGTRIDSMDVPLSWSQPAGAESYDVLMYYHDGSDWTQYYLWEGKSGGAFTVWPVVDETYYSWAIRACNGQGCSEWSDFQQFYFAGL